MEIKSTGKFNKQVKRLRPNQKADLDLAILCVKTDPMIGELKTGDLAWLRVHKCRVVGQLWLLGCEVLQGDGLLVLHTVGSHENFYRDLKAKD